MKLAGTDGTKIQKTLEHEGGERERNILCMAGFQIWMLIRITERASKKWPKFHSRSTEIRLSGDKARDSVFEHVSPGEWSRLWTTIPNTGFPGGSDGKASTCNAGDPASIPESGGFPGEGKLLQYSCLGNSTDRGASQATVHRVAKSRTRLSN